MKLENSSRLRSTVPLLIAALVLVGIRAARAGGCGSDCLTLAEAVSRALEEGHVARIARLASGRAEDVLGGMRGAYLPQVSISSQAGYSDRRDEKLRAVDKRGRERKYGLSSLGSNRGWFNFYVDQLLLDLKQWRLIERQEFAVEAARVVEAQERERIAYDVTRRFTEVVRLQHLAALTAELVKDAVWLDDQAETLWQAGRTLQTERELARLHRIEAEMEARIREAEVAAGRAALWVEIGGAESNGTPIRLDAESLPVPDFNLTPDDVEEAILATSELRALRLRVQVEEASVSAAGAGRYPTVGLRAGYSNYGADRYDNYEDEFLVGLNMEVPLFDGFRSKRAISEAMKGAEITRLRYESMLRNKRARVDELKWRLAAAQGRLDLAERRAAAAREWQRLTDARVQAQRTRLEESRAARSQTAHETHEATDSYFARIELWTELHYELGRLSAMILGKNVPSPEATGP